MPLTVFFGIELAQIKRRYRGLWVWSEKHLHQFAYYPTTTDWDTVATAVKKTARALMVLQVKKIVVKWNEGEARLLYLLLAKLGVEPVPPIEAWPGLRVEPLWYMGQDVARVIMIPLMIDIWILCQEHLGSHRGRPLSWKYWQLCKQ